MKELGVLIRKDLLIEWRQRYAVSGILLHVISSVFIIFLSVKFLNPPTWNALFWVIMLFTSISAVAKSFISESQGRSLYYFGVTSPQLIILSRIIYNVLLMLLISIVSFGVYIVMMGNAVQNIEMYFLCVLLGCAGFGSTFTLLSSIASKAGNSHLLMPVLSIPVIVPLFLVLIKASKKAMDGIDPSLITPDLFVLFCINVLVITLAYLLFPFLWKN